MDDININIELLKTGMAFATVKVHTDDGSPVEDVKIVGFLNSDKGSVLSYTNSAGIASGYVAPGASAELTITNMMDVETSSLTIQSPTAGNRYEYDWTVVLTPYKRLSVSGTYYMSSHYSSCSYELVGGGGGGAASCATLSGWTIYGGGGGGGNTTYGSVEKITPRTAFRLAVGSGGIAGTAPSHTNFVLNSGGIGGLGGTTSAFGLEAAGGYGGGRTANITGNVYDLSHGGGSSNGGYGGDGKRSAPSSSGVSSLTAYQGGDGKCTYHTSLTETDIAGGGGGGASAMAGGKAHGGTGGIFNQDTNGSASATGKSGTFPGGGGGGGVSYGPSGAQNHGRGGKGGAGAIILMFS